MQWRDVISVVKRACLQRSKKRVYSKKIIVRRRIIVESSDMFFFMSWCVDYSRSSGLGVGVREGKGEPYGALRYREVGSMSEK